MEFLEEEEINLKQIQHIVLLQISESFIQKLSMRLNVPIELGNFDLIINVGSGIQVGCVPYYF
jgi:hypothetical protein